ncbi:hypothetical protein M2308_005251 [Rhizobium leguminosarum]|nr:hypothetical protein [Rhizobium leguminosarum]
MGAAVGLGTDARPVGWQDIINPQITRRGLLGGLGAAPLLLYASKSHAEGESWYDLQFELAEDQRSLTVLEIKVTPAGKPNADANAASPDTRVVACWWNIPALAFGPAAYFDMEEPAAGDIGKVGPAPARTVYARNVDYGLRFAKGDKSTVKAGSSKPGFIGFRFQRPGTRWTIEYITDLWVLTKGGVDSIRASRPAEFHAFMDPDPDPGTRPLPFEDVVHSRVGSTLDIMFAGQVGVRPGSSGYLRVTLDRNLVWTVKRVGDNAVSALDGRLDISEFNFAWRRANPEAAPTDAARSGSTEAIYFSGQAGPNDVKLTGSAGVLEIGRSDGHQVRLRPGDLCTVNLDVITGPASSLPRQMQVVSALSIGEGVLQVRNGTRTLTDGLAGRNLVFAQTDTPQTNLPRVRRTVLWGQASGTGPLVGKPDAKHLKWQEKGDVPSPVGLLGIGAPQSTTRRRQTEGEGADSSNEALPPETTPAKDKPEAAPLEVTITGPQACKPIASVDATGDHLARFFQAVNGDRGGVPDATLYVLHDRPYGNTDASAIRRIHFDVSLFSTNAALPDTSFSRLTFRSSDLRLVYEDGAPIAELKGGEDPRPIAGSFVWLGPMSPGERRASFDLSDATLTCGRDYDLMKLCLRFRDLLLEYKPEPRIVPARDDARVHIGDDGAVHDTRPIIVAELSPQHLMEAAIFRPEAPPLPDVDLDKPANAGDQWWTRENILAALANEADREKRKNLRLTIQGLKIQQEGKTKSGKPQPFKAMAEAFAQKAKTLPSDQQIYIGPFAIDADGMGVARVLITQIGPAAVEAEVDDLLARVNVHAHPAGPLSKLGKLAPVKPDPTSPAVAGNATPDYRGSALRNEAVFESLEPLYGVFRTFWRDTIVTYLALVQHNVPSKEIFDRIGFIMPAEADPARYPEFGEFLIENNRFVGYDEGKLAMLVALMVNRFAKFALGLDAIPDLVGARLSGKSRLAFRIDCDPPQTATAYEAGTMSSSDDGPSRTGPGISRFKPIPFTFEGLTDWSRFEPAVTKRARKLFESLPSGLLPRPGSRSANPSDHAMMRFQGFSEGPITGASRMAEVRASLKSERVADLSGRGEAPFPGEPLDLETAIEIPARLILSTAQDAVWRTNRRMPPEVTSSVNDSPVAPVDGEPIGLEEGAGLAGQIETVSVQPRDLWSVRLETDFLKPDLRAVSSPDLRPSALIGPREPGTARFPGEGAPPRGPYAPWFIGPEQLESGTVAAQTLADELKDPDLCLAPKAPSKYRLIRWLCERAGFRQSLPVEDYTLFRTSLDAFDRHQLVLLTSTYGLPVIGKRKASAGSDEDADRAGGLVTDSGQIEPGEAFSLLDATDDQALHKPVSFKVKALSLTALGGSFLHETSFKPSAGANDFRGRKIFEGFSIDTLQQDIVLGRDIRTEVVYKGYCLPLGHQASFIKLTERIFLRTPNSGIKAMLRQRMFLRISEPEKLYGALAQPHAGRMWCAKRVRLLADKTPDILDPSIPLGPLSEQNPESLNGRIFLGDGPGLAFWPRTDITANGLHRFEVTFDGTPTSLPMIFVDNIAATTGESLKRAVDHYNGKLAPDATPGLQDILLRNRTLAVGGGKIDFAPNSKAGEAQFETEEILVRAHGRTRVVEADSWTGELEGIDNFVTSGVLEGAGQPPFYPAMQKAKIRLGPVERLSGGTPSAVEVQYDGHYVLYGFDKDSVARGLEPAKGANANPQEVFLNLRSVLNFGMGGNGDRAGGIARPESNIVAISRSKGPLGGDETTWWSTGRQNKAPDVNKVEQVNGKPIDAKLDTAMGSTTLVSLAHYFNKEVPRPALTPLKEDRQPAFAPKTPDAANLEILNQVQSFFSLDAKLLGTVKLKDLMTLLDLKLDSIPVLKEGLEYGTAALRNANSQLDGLSNDVRERVLAPLRDVIRQLRAEWNALDQSLRNKKVEVPIPGAGSKSTALSLADIYPEVNQGLSSVEKALDEALAAEDATALVPRLAAVHSAARELIRGLSIIASNPVERLEDAVIGSLQARILEVTDAIAQLQPLVASLEQLATDLLDAAATDVAEQAADWIYGKMAGAVPKSEVDLEASMKFLNLFPLAVVPLDLSVVLKALVADINKDAASLGKAILGSSPPDKGVGPILAEAVRDAARQAIRPTLKNVLLSLLQGQSVEAALMSGVGEYQSQVSSKVKTAIDIAKTAVAAFKTSAADAERRAALGLEAALNRYAEQLLTDTIDWGLKQYPDEIQVLVAGVERASHAFDSVKRVADAVKNAKLQEILNAGGTFAAEVLGIDVDGMAESFRQTVTAPIAASVREARKTLLPDQVVSVKADILLREIEACAPLKLATPQKSTLPLLDVNQKVEASTSLLVGLATALKTIEEVRASLPAVTEAASSSGFEAVSSKLTTFVSNLETFLGVEDSRPGGVSNEIAGLYSDIVDLTVAVTDLDLSFSGDDIDLAKIERIGSLAKQIRFLAKAIADHLTAIVRSTGQFAQQNPEFIAAGMIAGNVVVFASSNGIDLNTIDQTVRTALENARSRADLLEKSLVSALVPVIDLGLASIGTTTAGTAQGIKTLEDQLPLLNGLASKAGLSLDPEVVNLQKRLASIRVQLTTYGNLKVSSIPTDQATLVALFAAPLKEGGHPTLKELSVLDGGVSELHKAAKDLRDLESALLREWRALQKRLEGAPAEMKEAAENAVVTLGLFDKLATGYDQIKVLRNQLLSQAAENTFFAPFARRALIVETLSGLGPAGNGACNVKDPKEQNAVLAECDRLAQEVMVFVDARKLAGLKDDERSKLRQRIVLALRGWSNGQASPLLIVEQAKEMGKDLLRGNVLSAVDLGAFRDQLEDSIAALIPTKVKFSYDFGSTVAEPPSAKDIFQPKQGSEFNIVVRASYDLLTQKSDYSASANLGPFDIYLIGDVADALRLSFGGAAFSVSSGSSARFDVKYEDFEIGKDLEFAQQLQSYLTPKEGNGVFIQPMTRGAGIEVGYGINLGTIGVGVTSFFNVSLNVSAELPFGDDESLFKVSLGRRLSPFGMGVLPFVGSGYFSIYAAADGVRGFEASFEYGGGGAIGFGPLSAQCRISAGVFVRILKVNNKKTTEIYGTFFAGGSASIWVFQFSTSLYVRLGTAEGGAMYGEAIYSFSFSLGIADYDYSITAFKKENSLGSKRAALLPDGGGKTRFATADAPFGIDPITTGSPVEDAPGFTKIKTANQLTDWNGYAAYFDVGLLEGLSP